MFIRIKITPTKQSEIILMTVENIHMLKNVKQNVVLMMEPCDLAADVSLKAGNMLLNRFCIDEDAAFESTGVYYLKEQNTSWKWEIKISAEEMLDKKLKG